MKIKSVTRKHENSLEWRDHSYITSHWFFFVVFASYAIFGWNIFKFWMEHFSKMHVNNESFTTKTFHNNDTIVSSYNTGPHAHSYYSPLALAEELQKTAQPCAHTGSSMYSISRFWTVIRLIKKNPIIKWQASKMYYIICRKNIISWLYIFCEYFSHL